MRKATTSKILKTAKKLKKENKKWHFHILVPGCKFNKFEKYTLILEDTENKEQLIHISYKKPLKTGQILVELLHGKGISKAKKEKTVGESVSRLSAKVNQMVGRATELNMKGFSWHHHLLFPECIFNKDSRYWTLVFEDPLNGEIIEDMSKSKPQKALEKIEPLFYLQKK